MNYISAWSHFDCRDRIESDTVKDSFVTRLAPSEVCCVPVPVILIMRDAAGRVSLCRKCGVSEKSVRLCFSSLSLLLRVASESNNGTPLGEKRNDPMCLA